MRRGGVKLNNAEEKLAVGGFNDVLCLLVLTAVNYDCTAEANSRACLAQLANVSWMIRSIPH